VTAPAAAQHGERHVRELRFDTRERPFLVLFELTGACDLACRHCRAEASPARAADELTTAEVSTVLDDLASLEAPRPIVVLTGGDPFKRDDVAALVAHGSGRGLAMAVSPSGTPLASASNLEGIRRAGARTVSFSLDGASPATHDAFRQVTGSFQWTVMGCRLARQAGLRVQLNSTVTADTVHELPALLVLARELGVSLWSVFFLVAAGRGAALTSLTASETEQVLHFLYEAAPSLPLKTTEAPQYRRVVIERSQHAGGEGDFVGPLHEELAAELRRLVPESQGAARAPLATSRRPPLAVGDGRGVVFVSRRGDVAPSGFLPLHVGNVRSTPLTDLYRQSPLLQAIRDPDRLAGRCGRCEYRRICGGSRAHAFAATGDPLAEDPMCPYEPRLASG
jgi:radical SAM protein